MTTHTHTVREQALSWKPGWLSIRHTTHTHTQYKAERGEGEEAEVEGRGGGVAAERARSSDIRRSGATPSVRRRVLQLRERPTGWWGLCGNVWSVGLAMTEHVCKIPPVVEEVTPRSFGWVRAAEDVLDCHSRSSPDVTNSISDGSFTRGSAPGSPDSRRWLYHPTPVCFLLWLVRTSPVQKSKKPVIRSVSWLTVNEWLAGNVDVSHPLRKHWCAAVTAVRFSCSGRADSRYVVE